MLYFYIVAHIVGGVGSRVIVAQRELREPTLPGGDRVCFVGGYVMIGYHDALGRAEPSRAMSVEPVGMEVRPMLDDLTGTQAERWPGGKSGSEGLANTSRDTTAGAAKPQDGPMDRPGTEAEEAADEPMSGKPVAVSGDDPGVGLTDTPEPDIEGIRGM